LSSPRSAEKYTRNSSARRPGREHRAVSTVQLGGRETVCVSETQLGRGASPESFQLRFQSPVRELASKGMKRLWGVEIFGTPPSGAPVRMGQGKSKNPGPKDPRRDPGNKRKGNDLPEIPQDSPLGLMIKYWDTWESRKGKSEEKMIQYCMDRLL